MIVFGAFSGHFKRGGGENVNENGWSLSFESLHVFSCYQLGLIYSAEPKECQKIDNLVLVVFWVGSREDIERLKTR